jgi:hypothetical protein
MTDTEPMTEVRIDISLFTKDESIGVISGPIRVRCIPQVGDALDFHIAIKGPMFDGHHLPVITTVTDRIITANSDEAITLMLSDITAATRDHALEVAELFVSKHGLFFDPTEL